VDPLLVRAARREPVERTPVWFMRQAGRSLPEYRAIRERYSFFEVNRSAELTAEVTLQPVRRHGVDAAVVFADIMTPVVAMGVGVELVEGIGPVIAEPVRTAEAVAKLRVPEPREAVAPVLEGISLVRGDLADERAVVGFCGGPFTVAGYLVEGRPSRDFAAAKALMYTEPTLWHALLEKLADAFAAYTLAQAEAGADIVQLFDSWVGVLSPADYEEFVAPWSGRVLRALREAGVPTIHFGTCAAGLLPAMAEAGGDVIGLDWRVALDQGWAAVGAERGVQGNLDPAVLLGPWPRVEAAAREVIARAAGRPGHIFNLGHGVLPETDPGVLGRVCGLVLAETARESLGEAAREGAPHAESARESPVAAEGARERPLEGKPGLEKSHAAGTPA
jgi:uroporphyrinogen decarboxylase